MTRDECEISWSGWGRRNTPGSWLQRQDDAHRNKRLLIWKRKTTVVGGPGRWWLRQTYNKTTSISHEKRRDVGAEWTELRYSMWSVEDATSTTAALFIHSLLAEIKEATAAQPLSHFRQFVATAGRVFHRRRRPHSSDGKALSSSLSVS